MKKFIKKRLLGKFGPTKRITDAALVGGAALSYAQRKGWVTESTAKKLGSESSAGGADLSIGEIALLAGAAWRLLRSITAGRGRSKKIIIDVE